MRPSRTTISLPKPKVNSIRLNFLNFTCVIIFVFPRLFFKVSICLIWWWQCILIAFPIWWSHWKKCSQEQVKSPKYLVLNTTQVLFSAHVKYLQAEPQLTWTGNGHRTRPRKVYMHPLPQRPSTSDVTNVTVGPFPLSVITITAAATNVTTTFASPSRPSSSSQLTVDITTAVVTAFGLRCLLRKFTSSIKACRGLILTFWSCSQNFPRWSIVITAQVRWSDRSAEWTSDVSFLFISRDKTGSACWSIAASYVF